MGNIIQAKPKCKFFFLVQVCRKYLSSTFGNTVLSLKEFFYAVGGQVTLSRNSVSLGFIGLQVWVCRCAASRRAVIMLSLHIPRSFCTPRSFVPTGVFHSREREHFIHDDPSASLTQIYSALAALTPNPSGIGVCAGSLHSLNVTILKISKRFNQY